jgi:predicted O-methyltransferase YrrM
MRYQNPEIDSSYRENNLGRTLYEVVIKYRPKKIVEFGTLNGYSTVAMAMALDTIGFGRIIGYDLFDKYPYKHSSKENTQRNIDRYGLQKYVELRETDFTDWLKKPESFDLFHLDISNTGMVIRSFYAAVKNQLQNGAIAIFEGGSVERDRVDWMIKYNKPLIRKSGVPFTVIDKRFPSLSQMRLAVPSIPTSA